MNRVKQRLANGELCCGGWMQIGQRHNKAAGMHVVLVDPHLISKFTNEGFTFIALSMDCVMLRHACAKVLQER